MYQPRGFANIFEHDNIIISNWNEIVRPEDTVYVLGDVMLGNNSHGIWCFNQLNGDKYIILGNHDTLTRQDFYWDMNGVKSVLWADMIRFGKYHFFLCHYPTLTDNFDRYRKLFNLHGHTHSSDKFQLIEHCCYNVALDAHDNKPVEIEQIIEDIRQIRQEYNNGQTQT